MVENEATDQPLVTSLFQVDYLPHTRPSSPNPVAALRYIGLYSQPSAFLLFFFFRHKFPIQMTHYYLN